MRLWRRCSGAGTYQPESCKSFFEMLGRRSVWQTPTLFAWSEIATIGTSASYVRSDQIAYVSRSVRECSLSQKLNKTTPEIVRDLRAAAQVGAAVTRDMAQAGVPILTGCDFMIAGFCVQDELATMVRGGMTPLAALQTATINPAPYFSLQESLGSVAPGRAADLVLLDGNPLTDKITLGALTRSSLRVGYSTGRNWTRFCLR